MKTLFNFFKKGFFIPSILILWNDKEWKKSKSIPFVNYE